MNPTAQKQSLFWMELAQWFLIGVACLFLLCFLGLFILFNVGILWIKYAPLPALPSRTPTYSLFDTGKTLDYSYSSVNFAFAENLHTPDDTLFRLTPSGTFVAQTRVKEQAVPDKKVGLPRNSRIRGYNWERLCFTHFFKISGNGEVIGNTYLATACASSGGTSEPHGRWIPLIWRGDGVSEDLNSLIVEKDWYVFLTLDINDRGQILCLANQTDIKGAEHLIKPYHLVILTPQSRT